jgi:hypothetical protein
LFGFAEQIFVFCIACEQFLLESKDGIFLRGLTAMIFPEKRAPFEQTFQSIDTEQARPAGNTMSKVARRDRLFEFSLSRPADDLEQLRDQQAFVVRK